MNLISPNPENRLSVEEIEVRIWAFVVIAITIILFGIVFALLYSVTFVVQPIKSMAPIDQAFTKMLNDIVLLIVGGIGGVMSRKGVQALAEKLGTPTPTQDGIKASASLEIAPKTAITAASGMPDFNWMGFKNPELDESWRPPPPPTTPPDHLHPEREEIAQERAAARVEGL